MPLRPMLVLFNLLPGAPASYPVLLASHHFAQRAGCTQETAKVTFDPATKTTDEKSFEIQWVGEGDDEPCRISSVYCSECG